MTKSPARIKDRVINPYHGDGLIDSGNPTVTFEGQPIACAGDYAIFEDGVQGVIIEGNACVMVNGKRIALLGDNTLLNGVICKGAKTIQVKEGKPFVFLGANVHIGKNVSFNCRSDTTVADAKKEDEEYIYYVVNSIGGKVTLATFGVWQILDSIANIDLGEYFEEDRWEEDPEEGGISNAGRPKAATVTIIAAAANEANQISMRQELISKIKLLHPITKSHITTSAGELLKAVYNVYDAEVYSARLYDINPIGIYKDPDYQFEIKKIMTGPSLVQTPKNGYHWESLFIWVVKK